MKALSQYINEYLIKKKLDKVRTNYLYHPKTKSELIDVINQLTKSGETDFNVIDTSEITDMSDLFSNVSQYAKYAKEIKFERNKI